MDVSVIVAAATTSTRDTQEHPTVGELADAVAQTHAVDGNEFTLKIDGRVADRAEPTQDLGDEVLELIEVADDDSATEASDDEEADAAPRRGRRGRQTAATDESGTQPAADAVTAED